VTTRLRKAADRGRARTDWLDSRHTFSFGEYHDPAHMGFGPLRVINEDRVAPGGGFPTHGHRDMEIISYVLGGALEHRDSLGTGSVIRPGDVQRMSAGSGIRHSEFNASKTEPVHFLQIWVMPDTPGLAPGYEQKSFTDEQKHGRWLSMASPDGLGGAVRVQAPLRMLATRLNVGEAVSHALAPGRIAWLQLARGSAVFEGLDLEAGDGVAITAPGDLTLTGAAAGTEALLFDMAP